MSAGGRLDVDTYEKFVAVVLNLHEIEVRRCVNETESMRVALGVVTMPADWIRVVCNGDKGLEAQWLMREAQLRHERTKRSSSDP